VHAEINIIGFNVFTFNKDIVMLKKEPKTEKQYINQKV